jgi:acyl transferase domain-containing protein
MTESTTEGIAIVGLTCRFPGAANVDEFWRNLVAGKESISTFSDEELAASGLDVAALRKNPNYVAARGIVPDPEMFDALFFGISAKEAEVTDPQQRLFLEASWEALENAGYDPEREDSSIGVYAGMGRLTYYTKNLNSRPDVVEMVGERMLSLGNDPDYLATRVAYKLNLKGPAINVGTACSTSLVAVCQACQGLLNYQCDLALAGGVSVLVPQRSGAYYQDGGIFSPDGHCRPFDARGQGTVFSDGVGIVVLKRLEDALKDGDQIFAVIKGSGLNNDGSDKVGFTAPSVDGQAEAIVMAQAEAGFDPATISYVECHGTATPIGDPIEIAALTQAFRERTSGKNFCAIGSVKSNIGHLGAAAGVAGLIKTVLALKHQKLPPSLHFTQPNPKIDFAASPFFVNSKLTEWKAGPTPHRAGVSSFGLGGTNAHVVLEEAPVPEASSPSREWQLLLLSAKSESALDAATANLCGHFKANPGLNLADAAFTLQAGRKAFDHRRILVCHDMTDAIQALDTRDPKRIATRVGDAQIPSVVFMFSGQGAQYVNMGVDLYRTESVFKEEVDRCSEILLPGLGMDLRQVLYPAAGKEKEAEELLTQTRITQPALFTIEYALATLWMSWGVKPAALIGHSIGEYVAACLAGVFRLEDALALVVQRGQLMQNMPRGSMLAVPMQEDELQKMLPATLSLATLNGPSQCVVSGPTPEVEAFLAALKASGKIGTLLHTSHAFHSAMMDPVLQPFAKCVSNMKRGQPKIPFLSNLTGTWIADADAVDPQYWAKHLRHTVRFSDGVKELLKEPNRVLLEVGPGTTLTSLARRQLEQPAQATVLSSMRHVQERQSDVAVILGTLGRLWMSGQEVDWPAFYAHERRRRVSLPTYPFERRRYWIEGMRQGQVATNAQSAVQRNSNLADWFYIPSWKRSELPDGMAQNNRLNWLVFADECGLACKLIEKLEFLKQDVVCVKVGDYYGKTGEARYTINPNRREDYTALISELHALAKVPQKILHFWSVSNEQDLEQTQNLGLHSLLFLAQALGEKNVTAHVQMDVVSNNIHMVTGQESVCPAKATVLGACKVIPLEFLNIHCRSIDILIPEAGTAAEAKLVGQLLVEVCSEPSDRIVACRGDYRWIEAFEAVHLEKSGDVAPRLKQGGVYLITGGLGGIGLSLAQFLATSVVAKLILIGRSVFPAKDQWQQWLTAHGDQDEVSRKIKILSGMEAAGAEIMIADADVSNLKQMRKVIVEAEGRFGRINGVIHAAGVADYAGVIMRRTREATAEVLASKVKGTLVLDELLGRSELDFLVLCSSISDVFHYVAFGQVGYVAANEFLDAFSYCKKATNRGYTVTINWNAWSEVGMAEKARTRKATREKSVPDTAALGNFLSPSEGVEVFNRVLGHAFQRVVVCATDLEVLRKGLPSPTAPQGVAQEISRPQADKHPRPQVGIAFMAATNEVERALAGIWQGLLGIEEIGVHDNFFDLGGDSLLLMRVQVKIAEALHVELSSAEMFEHPTISTLARRLSQPVAQTAGLEAVQNRAQMQRAAMDRQRAAMKHS